MTDIVRGDLDFLLLPSIDRYPSLVRPCEVLPFNAGEGSTAQSESYMKTMTISTTYLQWRDDVEVEDYRNI